MRISDWSSDVCSSDLTDHAAPGTAHSGELVTRVFQLRYENAAHLMPVLRPLIAPNNSINVYMGNNTLVLTERKSVMKGQSVTVRVDIGVSRVNKKITLLTPTSINGPIKQTIRC